jgi:hypothetical protein
MGYNKENGCFRKPFIVSLVYVEYLEFLYQLALRWGLLITELSEVDK